MAHLHHPTEGPDRRADPIQLTLRACAAAHTSNQACDEARTRTTSDLKGSYWPVNEVKIVLL